jgi:hypothetical protein
MHEVKSSLIFQPRPASVKDGLAERERIIGKWSTAKL